MSTYMKTRRLSLPDEQHVVLIQDYSTRLYVTVMHITTMRYKEDFTVLKSNPQWNDLVHQFCELARKKYPRQLRHKSISIERQRRGL